jgi:two-component system osmolarity sensor histidine kinase EnvZ
MLEDYLLFASEQDEETGFTAIALSSLFAEVAEGAARGGRSVETEVKKTLTVEGRPTGLRRAVENLVGNALRYGNRVRLSAEPDQDSVLIHVDDDGPGIPAARREEAMRAFTRLDPARSGASGTGLGLAIVRDVARSHGGGLSLGESPLGGLRATITLPR